MPVLLTVGSGHYLQRTTGLLNPAADHTYMAWVREPATVAVPPAYNTPFVLLDDPGAYLQSGGLSTQTGAAGTALKITGMSSITTSALAATSWAHFAWVQEGTTQRLYRNALLIGSGTANRSGFVVGFDLLGNDSFGPGGLTVAYARQWQAALTQAEIRAERNSRTALRTAGLFLDTPLEADLTDVSGNGRNWTQIGTGTFLAEPTLLATFTDAATFPFQQVVSVADFNVSNMVWFRVNVTTPLLLGQYATRSGSFFPRAEVMWAVGGYTTTGATTPTSSQIAVYSGTTQGWWYYLPAGSYYVRYRRNGAFGAITDPFTITFEKTLPQASPVVAGTLVVNDDSTAGTSPPSLQLAASTLVLPTGGVLAYAYGPPASETGDALPNGYSLWHDRFRRVAEGVTAYFALFDPNLTYLQSVDTTPSAGDGGGFPCICNDGTRFYILDRATNEIGSVTQAGVVTNDVAALPAANDAQALGVTRDASAFYWAEGYDSNIIYKHTVATGTSVPFYTVNLEGLTGYVALSAVNNNPGEILVLPNGELVTYYYLFGAGADPDTSILLHLSADGAVLHTHRFNVDTFGAINHIHYAVNWQTEVSIWFYKEGDFTRGIFARLLLATGALVDSVEHPLFSVGANAVPNPQTFGPSSSCTMLAIQYGTGSPTTACPPQAWLTAASPGCVAIGEL